MLIARRRPRGLIAVTRPPLRKRFSQPFAANRVYLGALNAHRVTVRGDLAIRHADRNLPNGNLSVLDNRFGHQGV